MDTVKRSSTNEMPGDGCGVGARHGSITSTRGQGGYLNICTTDRFSKKNATSDSRLAELREIGLAAHWIDVAASIGVDNFLTTWAILSNSDVIRGEKHYAYVPRYSVWMRYQRNRVIMSLHADGLLPKEIRVRIGEDLNELVSVDHIKRIIAKGQSGNSSGYPVCLNGRP
jgi:hypothetical protein